MFLSCGFWIFDCVYGFFVFRVVDLLVFEVVVVVLGFWRLLGGFFGWLGLLDVWELVWNGEDGGLFVSVLNLVWLV